MEESVTLEDYHLILFLFKVILCFPRIEAASDSSKSLGVIHIGEIINLHLANSIASPLIPFPTIIDGTLFLVPRDQANKVSSSLPVHTKREVCKCLERFPVQRRTEHLVLAITLL